MERNEEQILSAKSVTVRLGGQDYTIKPQPKGQSRAFRAKCRVVMAHVNEIARVLSAAVPGSKTNIQLVDLLPIVMRFFLEEADQMCDLIFEYDPALGTDEARKQIDENATDEECIDAFIVILGLAFGPFGLPLIEKLNGMGGVSRKTS